ncbi:hypothetical protein LMG27952_06583 [Paraburkholderia hiiakae]|uniref:Uncharacterized protein n=1 Tax=Paraburkholderia hiiakae TaxID=1081782 RepID=A0ABM8P7G8_9BURK|nr:hypothetical protein LMG27952_06583 [Paraburkholderia hiiakae]
MDEVTQQNAAFVEEATAAGQCAAGASNPKELVSILRVGAAHPAPGLCRLGRCQVPIGAGLGCGTGLTRSAPVSAIP